MRIKGGGNMNGEPAARQDDLGHPGEPAAEDSNLHLEFYWVYKHIGIKFRYDW